MTAIVPDTLQGALIVSVIDFFLSFVIISGIGVVLALFPLLNRLAHFRMRARPAAATTRAKRAASSGKAVISDNGEGMVEQDDIAAIAAAVKPMTSASSVTVLGETRPNATAKGPNSRSL